MKYELLLLTILFNLNVFAQEYERKVIILVDTGANEYKKKSDSFAIMLLDALLYKTVPIIVSGSVLHNFLYIQRQTAERFFPHKTFNEIKILKKDLFKKISDYKIKFENEKNKILEFINQNGKICEEHLHYLENVIKIAPDYATLLNNLSNITNCKQPGCKNLSQQLNNMIRDLEKTEKEFSLNMKNLIDNPGTFYLSEKAKIFEIDLNDTNWDIYKSIGNDLANDLYLLIPKDYKEKIQQENISSINEYKSSLGFRVQTPSVLQRIQSFQELEATLEQDWGSFITYLKTKLPAFRNATIDNSRIQNIFIASKGKDNLIWTIYICGHGGYPVYKRKIGYDFSKSVICNMKVPNFLGFLKFLSRNIKTKLLIYDTCFGGGWHSKIIGDYLTTLETKSTDNQFTVITSSVADAISYDFNSFNFFDYTNDLETLKKHLLKITWYKLPIAVRNPKHKKFELLSEFPYTIIFKSGEIGDIHTIEGTYLYIYSPQIKAKLKLNKLTKIFSLQPGKYVHEFYDIEFDLITCTVLKNVFLDKLINKVFLIKNLTCKNDFYLNLKSLFKLNNKKKIETGKTLKLIIKTSPDTNIQQIYLAIKDNKNRVIEAYKTHTIHKNIHTGFTLTWDPIPVSQFNRLYLIYGAISIKENDKYIKSQTDQPPTETILG